MAHCTTYDGEFVFFVHTRASYTASRSLFASRSPALLDEDDRSASPDADGSARGGALGMALSLFIWSVQSPPTSDHPASISLGTPMGTGVASPAEYFSSLALVALFIFPIMSQASFLDTWIVSGKGTTDGCCPGRVAAPIK